MIDEHNDEASTHAVPGPELSDPPVAYDSAGQPTAFEKVFTPGGLRAWARREYRPGTDASPKLASLLQV